VAPQHLVTIAAPVDGNVAEVYAHEGQRVAAGDVLGTMNDWQWRTDLAASEAKYQGAMLVMENDLAPRRRAGGERTAPRPSFFARRWRAPAPALTARSYARPPRALW